MKNTEALPVAEDAYKRLFPYCHQITIVGSLRRNKEDVNDVDIVLRAKPYDFNLLESGITTVMKNWEPVNAEESFHCKTKNIRVYHESGTILDIYLANPLNYGYIATLRTGSEGYNIAKILPAIKYAGYIAEDGFIWTKDSDGHRFEKVPIPNEVDLFELIGLPFIHPHDRNY